MKRRMLQLMVCGFLVLALPALGRASQREDGLASRTTISSTKQVRVQHKQMLVPKEVFNAKPSDSAPAKPKTLKELLLKTKPIPPGEKPLDTLSVEPWMPGRGSLGVQLQVTW